MGQFVANADDRKGDNDHDDPPLHLGVSIGPSWPVGKLGPWLRLQRSQGCSSEIGSETASGSVAPRGSSA